MQSSLLGDVIQSESVSRLEDDAVCVTSREESVTARLLVCVGSYLRLGQEEASSQAPEVDILVLEVLHNDLMFLV